MEESNEKPPAGPGAFSLLRAVEPSPIPPGEGVRPKTLTWLCVASFANQGLVFPLYLMGILAAVALKGMPTEEIRHLVETTYAALIRSAAQDELMAYIELMKAHGVALMGVFALRTLARFVGTLRMWQGWKDGFHIYTMAQLLGVLLPILVAGPKMFSFIGFILALNWCYLYFIHRKILRVPAAPPGMPQG